MSSNTSAISIENLNYAFQAGQPVLKNLSIQVPKGSIYGFLGPNGAGKTTTMRLLTGLLPQQGEHILFFGQSLGSQLPELFHKVGALIETPSLYLHLRGLLQTDFSRKWITFFCRTKYQCNRGTILGISCE
jgi:ABC-2 type transport system ATP-binding protein